MNTNAKTLCEQYNSNSTAWISKHTINSSIYYVQLNIFIRTYLNLNLIHNCKMMWCEQDERCIKFTFIYYNSSSIIID